MMSYLQLVFLFHDDVIKWKHFPRYWPFVRGIHPSPVNSPHKGQLRRALMFSFICVWIDARVNNREAGDLRCYHAHYDVTVMLLYPLMHILIALQSLNIDTLVTLSHLCLFLCLCMCICVCICISHPWIWHASAIYRQISNISRTKSRNLNASRLVLQLSLCNILKPGVETRIKM